MATPSLTGFNLLNPRKTGFYKTAVNGLSITQAENGAFTVSGTPTRTGTWSFSAFYYSDTSLSGKGYTLQVWLVSGDPVIIRLYGLRTATERSIALTVNVTSGVAVSETFRLTLAEGSLSAYAPYRIPVITDRTKFDVAAVKAVKERLNAGTGTAADLAAFNAGMKGAMGPDDWLRIDEAIRDYRALNPSSSIRSADVMTFENNVVLAACPLAVGGLAALKRIAEAIYADGFGDFSKVPPRFGDGTTLDYRAANNIEALLAAATAPQNGG